MTRQRGRDLLQALKAHATTGPPCLCLPSGDPVEAVLRPVATEKRALNAADVRVLTEWRNRFVTSFLTEFEATEPRTARWLIDTVGPDPTRILFMLDDARGRTIGYLGLAFIDWDRRIGELDALVRGQEGPRGVMKRSVLTLIGWAYEQLGLDTVAARVRSDNRSLPFFSTLARETHRVPLRRVEQPGMVQWVEDPAVRNAPASLVYVTFTRP